MSHTYLKNDPRILILEHLPRTASPEFGLALVVLHKSSAHFEVIKDRDDDFVNGAMPVSTEESSDTRRCWYDNNELDALYVAWNAKRPLESVLTKTGAIRANLYPKGAKFPARYDLLMRNAVAMRRMAEVFGEGFAKYGADNWMKGFEESVLISHQQEHIRSYLAGDTSEDHLSHATWNLMTLMWVQENMPELLDLTKSVQKL